MQSNNPVFNNNDGFNGKPYAASATQVITDAPTRLDTRRMTIDSVVQRTAFTLGVVIITALATWTLTPDLSDPTANLSTLYLAMTVGSLGAFALSMVNSFKRIISPALVLAFAAWRASPSVACPSSSTTCTATPSSPVP